MRSRWCPGNTPKGTPAPHVPIPPLPTAQGQRAVATVVLPAGDPGHGLSPGLRPRRAEGTPARLRAATPRRQSPPVHGVPQDAPLPLQSANELKFTPRRGWVQLQPRLSEEKGLPAPTPQSAREPCGMPGGFCPPRPAPPRAPPALPLRAGLPQSPDAHRARAERHRALPAAGWVRVGRVPAGMGRELRRGSRWWHDGVLPAPERASHWHRGAGPPRWYGYWVPPALGIGSPSVARVGPIGTGDRVCLGGVIGSHWFRKESPLVARRGPAGSARGSHSHRGAGPYCWHGCVQSAPSPSRRAPPRSGHGSERPREPHGGRELRGGWVPRAREPRTPRGAPRPVPPLPHPPPDGAGEARRNDRE